MKEGIIQAIFKAIDEVNRQLPKERRIEKSTDTVLFGQLGKLDSLGLVTLIMAVEQKIEKKFRIKITLANENAMSQENSPFRTIGTLIDSIFLLLKENSNA